MWEQYGQQRQGAVLVFDKMAVIESIDEERKVADGDVFAISPVSYIDRPLQIPLEGWYDSVEAIRDALDRLTSDGKAIGDLFFVKNTDWSGETEFRVVVVLGLEAGASAAGSPLDLSYRTSLRAVVVGERWDGADWLPDSVARRRLGPSEVVRCDWVNGAPVLRSYELR